jgi:riboflavin synthase
VRGAARSARPKPVRVAVVDTTFARVDMAREALAELERDARVQVERATVPGMKDLPVACKRLLDQGCALALALAWVGGEPIDEQCAHEANLGLQWAQLMTNKHILGVFFHESETRDAARQKHIARERAREHAQNALWLLFAPEELRKRAGTGQRQGGEDVGPLP